MTSLSSSFRSPRSQSSLSFLFLMLAIAFSSSAGCEDKHIGRPCNTGLPVDPTTAAVNAQALECPSRICLLPAVTSLSTQEKPTTALCTDYCNSDDDCADGEARNSSTNPAGCSHGFACRVAVGHLQNPIACKRVCVCKDFLSSDEINNPPPKPPACP